MSMKTWLLRAVAAAVLALVFLAYLRPSLLLELGNQIALCF